MRLAELSHSCRVASRFAAPALSHSAATLGRRRPAWRRRAHVRVRSQVKQKKETKSADPFDEAEEREKLRQLEDELRDPSNFIEYFLPRPLRLTLFLGSSLSCLLALLLSVARALQDPLTASAPLGGSGGWTNVAINAAGLATFAALYVYDERQADKRIERRQEVRAAQIKIGDREVYVDQAGRTMSRLKEVDDAWILRRLERWGRRDGMPFVGPEKGAVLQSLVREAAPRLAVEVGTMAGYSAIVITQALPEQGRLITMESQWTWWLAAKRFLWQASSGAPPRLRDKVDVQLGDAKQLLARLPKELRGDKVDFLFLDGLPREYLDYLSAAEPLLAPGALVVADNAGVFAEGGLKPYLEYVRGSPKYDSRFIEGKLEWRDDVADGIEVSRYLG